MEMRLIPIVKRTRFSSLAAKEIPQNEARDTAEQAKTKIPTPPKKQSDVAADYWSDSHGCCCKKV
jgi:hypothetical protein